MLLGIVLAVVASVDQFVALAALIALLEGIVLTAVASLSAEGSVDRAELVFVVLELLEALAVPVVPVVLTVAAVVEAEGQSFAGMRN